MKIKPIGIILVLITGVMLSFAQILMKYGANKLVFDFLGLITNYYLILGIFLYAISFVILVSALKYGDLSILYPILAVTYIWVSLLSPLFFKSDSMNSLKWIGIIIIISGIVFINLGGKK